MICPQHCVCQYAHRMDLPIARWIHSVETRQKKGHEFVDLHDESMLNSNNNEVTFKLQIFLIFFFVIFRSFLMTTFRLTIMSF